MEFYYSREHPPSALFSTAYRYSLFSFCILPFPLWSFLSTSRLGLVTQVHSKRNYPMQRRPMYVCGLLAREGQLDARLSKHQTKLFSVQSQSAGRPSRHLLRRTYQSRRRASISNPWIANRLPLRNLNRAPVFWLPFANIRCRIDTCTASSTLADLSAQPAARVSSALLGCCEPIGIDYRWEKKPDDDYRRCEWSYSAMGISAGHCLSINHRRILSLLIVTRFSISVFSRSFALPASLV